jgi:N-acetylmuramoyl-L-alanine amidase
MKCCRGAVKYIMGAFVILVLCCFANAQASYYQWSEDGVIVIDAGHGGVDGGANRDGLLEKNINLSLALKLKTHLEEKGYAVILTRDKDVSLDSLNNSSSSRHKRDLIARADIINAGSAQLFLSIHVNSLTSDPAENGSIVFYSRRFMQSKALADFMQKQLNGIKIGSHNRKRQVPLFNRYYILGSSNIPGVLIETAFITNHREKEMLATDGFLNALAVAIAEGTDLFLKSESRGSVSLTYDRLLTYNKYGFSDKEATGWI